MESVGENSKWKIACLLYALDLVARWVTVWWEVEAAEEVNKEGEEGEWEEMEVNKEGNEGEWEEVEVEVDKDGEEKVNMKENEEGMKE